MRWSSIVKNVPGDNDPQNADVTVLEYNPKVFDFGTPQAAFEYLKSKQHGSDFIMSDVLRETTGVEEIERVDEEQKVEKKVLEKISVIQEDAYNKAYELGFAEGKQKAIEENMQSLREKSEFLDKLLEGLNRIKEELIYQNEAHIIRLIFEIASKLAFDHVHENQEVLLKVIKKAIDEAQADENVVVTVSTEQFDFLDKIKQNPTRETDFLKKVKFESSDSVTVGSCIVETNYGVIDARLEERIAKLWAEFKQATPKIKPTIESE